VFVLSLLRKAPGLLFVFVFAEVFALNVLVSGAAGSIASSGLWVAVWAGIGVAGIRVVWLSVRLRVVRSPVRLVLSLGLSSLDGTCQ
jgi:hypothetical protein